MIVSHLPAGIAFTLSLGNKVLHKLIINKYNKYKKQHEKGQQTVTTLDGLYRKSLYYNVIDKSEYEYLSIISTKYVDGKIKNLFYKYEYKGKIKFFSNKKLKFQPTN